MLATQATQVDIANLYGVLGVPPLKPAQEQAVLFYLNRVPVSKISELLGVGSQTVKKWLSLPTTLEVLDFYNARLRTNTEITRELLNEVLMETLYLSNEARDRIAAVKELGHLNGLYPEKGMKLKVEAMPVSETLSMGSQKMSELSEEQLVALSSPAPSVEKEEPLTLDVTPTLAITSVEKEESLTIDVTPTVIDPSEQ